MTSSAFYSLRDMVTMTKGKHSLYFGGEFALDKGMFVGNLYNFGVFAFSPSAPTTTGNGLSDLVTGQVNSMEQDTPYHTLESAWHTGLFFQDQRFRKVTWERREVFENEGNWYQVWG